MPLSSAANYYRDQQALTALAVRGARRANGVAAQAGQVAAYQAASALLADEAAGAMLAEQGLDPEPVASLNPAAFTADTRNTAAMIQAAATDEAIDRVVATLVADSGRNSMGAATVARPSANGHVRYLQAPSCARCAVLAGRFYRWSTGFQRHPRCDCQMVPTSSAVADGLISDPMVAFERGDIRGLSRADAEALREGADLSRVVNIKSRAAGLTPGSSTLTRGGRLTPDGIYRIADNDRDEAVRLLREQGYLTSAAATPGASRIAPRAPSEWGRWKSGRDVHVDADNLPDFDADNPLAVYGDRLQIQGENETTALHLRELEEHFSEGVHVTLRDHFADTPEGGFYIGDEAVPELDDLGHLRGVQPRGWDEAATWDTVPGAFNPATRVCACGGGGHGHGTTSLALHEGSHALDNALGMASRSDEFIAAYFDVHGKLHMNPYFTHPGNPEGYLSEGFAETFAAYSKSRSLDREGQIDALSSALADGHVTSGPETRASLGRLLDYFSGIESRMVSR